jgi:heptosyltransferase-2
MKVAVLKPDHLGDLVLAAPALAALRRHFADLTLYCHPKNLGLADHLFPGLPAHPVLLPHQDKEHTTPLDDRTPVRVLRGVADLLVCLRWDGPIADLVTELGIPHRGYGSYSEALHAAAEQHTVVAPLTGPYDMLSSYRYPHIPPVTRRPEALRAVGLCIAAGFRLNAWPLGHWLGLAERLHRHGTEAVLIGGPAEATRLRVLAAGVRDRLGYGPRVLVGGSRFGAFLRDLAEHVDLVVATDSGTAHLASLVRPVVSLFGGSPWWRFAPLGSCNAVLCRRLPCSPCRQFQRDAVNTCHTQECLANLFPEQVWAGIRAYLDGVDLTQERQVEGVWLAAAPWERAAVCTA